MDGRRREESQRMKKMGNVHHPPDILYVTPSCQSRCATECRASPSVEKGLFSITKN